VINLKKLWHEITNKITKNKDKMNFLSCEKIGKKATVFMFYNVVITQTGCQVGVAPRLG